MMKKIATLLLLVLSAHNCLGFTGPHSPIERSASLLSEKSAGMVAGLMTAAVPIIAKADELEYAELPPPYVPAIFGVVLLVGVGLLTSSLGNVMDEEAGLGMQSGARAKKEIERSRSSYFGKRPR